MSISERRFLAREEPAELQVARTSGGFLFDANGKKYVDFVMGWCVGNLGWSNLSLTRRAGRYNGPDYIYPGYSYKPWVELAKLLASRVATTAQSLRGRASDRSNPLAQENQADCLA